MEGKICKCCGRWFNLGEFYRNPVTPDGHLYVCKECFKAARRERYKKDKQDPSFMEKERARCREKYRRLYRK